MNILLLYATSETVNLHISKQTVFHIPTSRIAQGPPQLGALSHSWCPFSPSRKTGINPLLSQIVTYGCYICDIYSILNKSL